MNLTKEREDICAFNARFIEQLNSDKALKLKIADGLSQLCTYFHYTRGFIYQTDGFHFYHLRETVGNEDKSLREHFDINNLSHKHAKLIKNGASFYFWESDRKSPQEEEIRNSYNVKSIFIRHARDTQGKTVGFVGFADYRGKNTLIQEELHSLQMLSGLLAKEIASREYLMREKRAKKTLESIMNNMGVDIYVNGFEDHKMLYANKTMAAPYGGTKHFEGKKCWQALYNGKTGECDFCPKKHLIDEKGHPSKVYSWDYQRPFDKAWFRVFSAAFEWIDGQLAHVITSVDITHQKTIEAELIEAKEKAENLDRLKSVFLANMSHEIRTPLNAIVGFSDLLTVTEDAEDRVVYSNIIKENNALLLQLISDILDLSKMEAGMWEFTHEVIPVRKFCEEIVLSYRIKETNGLAIRMEGEGDFVIHSDKKRLMQVVTNFINNALKFTTQGSITLGYRLLKGTNEIEFDVRDTGMGIEPEKLSHVFERFVKLNAFAPGSGLGLSICKSIVEQLNGRIGVESEVGVGTRFWFTQANQSPGDEAE